VGAQLGGNSRESPMSSTDTRLIRLDECQFGVGGGARKKGGGQKIGGDTQVNPSLKKGIKPWGKFIEWIQESSTSSLGSQRLGKEGGDQKGKGGAVEQGKTQGGCAWLDTAIRTVFRDTAIEQKLSS